MPPKADSDDFLARFREIVSDPLNLLIEREPSAGVVEDGLVMLHNGIRVPVAGDASYYGDFSNILVINRGVHEPLEEYIFQELLPRLPEAPCMLELGAYWGHYSMWLKKARPQARVILVEPVEEYLEAGRQNFARNGVEGEFLRDFVGDGRFQVDAFLKDRGIETVSVLHADIQGFEVEMLQGAAETLRRRRADYVLVSTHSKLKHRGVRAALTEFGYRIEVSSDFKNHTTAWDGSIFATNPEIPPLFSGFRPMGRTDICASSSRELIEYVRAVDQARRIGRAPKI